MGGQGGMRIDALLSTYVSNECHSLGGQSCGPWSGNTKLQVPLAGVRPHYSVGLLACS